MEKTIWKFELAIDDSMLIPMPEDAEILSVQMQNGKPCMWAMVDPHGMIKQRCFEMFGTGHPIPVDMGVERKFINTFQVHNGALVFHVFERIN